MERRLPRPDQILNRELSWLAFNERVLEEAEDEANPLLERLKFLAIASSNWDEFFMVRVAGIWRQIDAGIQQPGTDGFTPRRLLTEVSRRIHEHVQRQHDLFRTVVLSLGGSRWQAVKAVVLPQAMPGIITGVILGLLRAAGEDRKSVV